MAVKSWVIERPTPEEASASLKTLERALHAKARGAQVKSTALAIADGYYWVASAPGDNGPTVKEAADNLDLIISHGRELLKVLQRFDRGSHGFGAATMQWSAPLPNFSLAPDPVTAELAADAGPLQAALGGFVSRVEQRRAAWKELRGSLPVAGRIDSSAQDRLVHRVYHEMWKKWRPTDAPDSDFRQACYAVLDLAGAHGSADKPAASADVLKHALTNFMAAQK
jgi:hypothetical protein